LALLEQVMALEDPPMGPERINPIRMNAIAVLAELQPATATEALLAAQMVGTQRLAMTFLARAMVGGQLDDVVDRNVVRATRLMRLFNEQVETMSKLKGKGGHQRVVVEHVTVAAGGQAVVGAVMPGGGGRVATTNDEPHTQRRGWLKNGNAPGDPTQAGRCGARTRRQMSCRGPAMLNGRCRLHGGKSTGPRTAEGLQRSQRARWKHGAYSREARAIRANSRRQWRELWALLASAHPTGCSDWCSPCPHE
jgi:hypothetical protein